MANPNFSAIPKESLPQLRGVTTDDHKPETRDDGINWSRDHLIDWLFDNRDGRMILTLPPGQNENKQPTSDVLGKVKEVVKAISHDPAYLEIESVAAQAAKANDSFEKMLEKKYEGKISGHGNLLINGRGWVTATEEEVKAAQGLWHAKDSANHLKDSWVENKAKEMGVDSHPDKYGNDPLALVGRALDTSSPAEMESAKKHQQERQEEIKKAVPAKERRGL